MIRFLVFAAIGYFVFAALGVQFVVDTIDDPAATFNSMPLWFWPFGISVFLGSAYEAMENK